MIKDDNYPDGQDGKSKDGSDQMNRKASQPPSDKNGNNSGSDFLDIIEGLALQQKDVISVKSAEGGNDLIIMEADNFPAIESDERTIRKIQELNSIVLSIESRPSTTAVIRLERSYKIDYVTELNNAQLEAVTTINGPVLVIAGAGSGKTRVIVYRVAFMLENGIDPDEMLLLTFTRKAAAEMLGRVQKLLNDTSTTKVFGGTFHSFSNFLLRKYAGLLNISPGFTIIDEEDSADTIDLIRSELKIDKKEKAFPRKNRIQEIISSARNRNQTIRDVVERDYTGLKGFISHIELISQAYTKYKRICNLFDYDDLMDVLRDALRDNSFFRKKLNERYRYIMIDEYQDTNVVQKEIVEYLAEGSRNIMVVGDDSQSIYSFRGADYENILRFPQKYPDCRVIKIEENYRSNQKILDFTNDIILNSKIGYKKRLWSNIKYEALPVVRKLYDQEAEAGFIVDKILEYREQGIALNQIAILVRAFWHARYIEAELNRRSIPYIAVGGLKFNERKHIKDVISYLRIIMNPYDAVAWHRVLKYVPGVGIVTASKIIGKIIAEKGFNIDEYENSKFAGEMKSLCIMLERGRDIKITLTSKIEIIKEYYLPIMRAREYDYQVRILDINVLIDLASKFDSLEKFLTEFALDPPSRNYGTKTIPLIDEGEDHPLTISTIHSAKGLEWYSVIIPHALDGLIPSVRALNNIEEVEEERRLFYVACSRAKQDLLITMPSFVVNYDAFLSYPSRFLVEIGKDKFFYK